MLDRRTFLTASGTSAALAALGLPAHALAAIGLKLGEPTPFSFESLTARAKALALQPYVAEKPLAPEVIERIDYEAHGRIRFEPDNALFKKGPGAFPVTFFHMGRFFLTPVHMHVLERASGDGFAREILYDTAYFDIPADSPARQLPQGAGFAGFRLQESRLDQPAALDWKKNDWVAFLGASYFRAIGELYQYGISARGIAIDVALPDRPEEFPNFTRFYFAPPAEGNASAMTVYALLEGPSITGAFRFVMQRSSAVVMDIDCQLFVRKDIGRLGLVPLTSMYWFSEAVKPAAVDWRPEVHDSDGLAIWTGAGERIWRPLNNPAQTRASSFADKGMKGFGLLQRDRQFGHYLDGVHYEKRPSVWVEPKSDWGEGAVQMVEIPTDDEIHDNIVAFWVPKTPAVKGSAITLSYRLHWTDREPYPTPLALCVATRLGRGGQPGQPRPAGVRKFVVEFIGKPLADIPFGFKPELVLTAPRGRFSYLFAEPVPNGVAGHWRAQFDYATEGTEAVDMRLFLKLDGQPLTETWLYQYQPA